MPYIAKNTILGKLEVLEIYEYYDIPRLFACINQYGHYYLALSVCETDKCHSWIYALISKKKLKSVRIGQVDLHDAFRFTEDECVFNVTTLSRESDTAIRVMCDDLESKWLPLKGPKLDIPKSRAIPKSSNLVLETPPLPKMKEMAESFDDIVVRAFSEVRGELSSDRMIADPRLDRTFIKRCLQYGLKANATRLNLRLMALRKAGELSHLSSKRDGLKPGVYNVISFASELALRLIRIRKGVTLDLILCDPMLVKEFDQLAKSMSPGFSALEYRLAALNVRKRGTFTRIEDNVKFEATENIRNLQVEKIPSVAGLYLFSSDDYPVFINQTNNLRDRLTVHLENSSQRGLPEWLWGKQLQHSYLEMPDSNKKFRENLEQTQVRDQKTFLNFYSKLA